MTNDIRNVYRIESAVGERAKCARDSQGHYPESINGCPVAWRMELVERLGTFDVCGPQPAVPTPCKRPQGDFGLGGVLEASPIEQHVRRSVDAELPTPNSVVCPCFVISAPYSLLIICSP